MNIRDVVVLNGSNYEVVIDKSTNNVNRFTLKSIDAESILPNMGSYVVICINRYKVVYTNYGARRITIEQPTQN
jgi:hypothetical protein